LKFINSIENNLEHDELLYGVDMRLRDLSECLIDRKKLTLLKLAKPMDDEKIKQFDKYNKALSGYNK